jgi:polyhydroxyalkanoate synthesis regulator phasin
VRTKLVTIAAVGALALGGAAVAGTALAATDDTSPTPAPARPAYGAPAPAQDRAARAERIEDALAGLVKDGTLTQAQADKVASTLAQSGLGRGPGGPRGLGGPRAGLAAAAKALGISETDLMTALRSGKSLAAVAKEKGVDVQKVIDALVAEAKQRLADAVKNGRLTQAQADERLKDVTARITERVNSTAPGRPGGFGHGRWGGGGPEAPAPNA